MCKMSQVFVQHDSLTISSHIGHIVFVHKILMTQGSHCGHLVICVELGKTISVVVLLTNDKMLIPSKWLDFELHM